MKTKSKTEAPGQVTVPQQRMPEGATVPPTVEAPVESRRNRRLTLIVVSLGAVLAAAIGSLVIAFSTSDNTSAPSQPSQPVPQGPANPGGRPYEDKVGGGTGTLRSQVTDGSDMSKYLAAIERGARLRAQRDAADGSDRRLQNLAEQRAAEQGTGLPGRP